MTDKELEQAIEKELGFRVNGRSEYFIDGVSLSESVPVDAPWKLWQSLLSARRENQEKAWLIKQLEIHRDELLEEVADLKRQLSRQESELVKEMEDAFETPEHAIANVQEYKGVGALMELSNLKAWLRARIAQLKGTER